MMHRSSHAECLAIDWHGSHDLFTSSVLYQAVLTRKRASLGAKQAPVAVTGAESGPRYLRYASDTQGAEMRHS